MSDFGVVLIAFVAAVNPAGALATMTPARPTLSARLPIAVAALAIGAGLLVVAALVEGPLLDALDLEPETFRISAGTIMVTAGAYALLIGPLAYPIEEGWRGALFPFAFPLLAGPASLAAAVAYADDPGEGEAIGAGLVVVAVTAALFLVTRPRARPLLEALTRLTGAVLIAIAVGLIVSGVRDV